MTTMMNEPVVAPPPAYDERQVRCAHCGQTFAFDTDDNKGILQCPHCQSVSRIGSSIRRRAIAFIVAGILVLIVSVTVSVVSVVQAVTNGGMYIVFIGLPIFGLSLIIRGIFVLCIKESEFYEYNKF